jgi:peroxiredoxin
VIRIVDTQPHAWRGRLLIPALTSAIALLVVILMLGRAFGQSNIRQAQPAPLFVLKEAGKTIRLIDFKNKALIICFVATWDDPSRKQLGILNDMVGQYGKTNLAVLALAIDQTEPDSAKAYAEKQHLRYALHVADYDVMQTFGGLTSIPVTIVIDKNQNIIDKFVGVTETNVLDADMRAILKQ